VSGDLSGTFQSALTSVQPVTEQPGTITFTARSLIDIRAPNGTISTVDAGIGTGCQLINGQYYCPNSNELLEIISGTRAYKQVRGSISLTGGYLAGEPGRYQGVLCRGEADATRPPQGQ
jgi:hypothetical protein